MKGIACSPYAVTDYFDVDPDLAEGGFTVGDIETLEDPMFGDDL